MKRCGRRIVSDSRLEFDPALIKRLSREAAERLSGEDESVRMLVRALRCAWNTVLTPVQRSYMKEYYINTKTMAQIASENGVNKTTVSRTLRRARIRLRHVLQFYL